MTQNTERAEFIHWYMDECGFGEMSAAHAWDNHQLAARAWQAARRAPAAQVPQGWRQPVPYKRSDNGKWATFNIRAEHADDAESALKAPQPPEAAQLPEPWGACVSGRIFVGKLPEHARKLAEAENLPIQLLYTAPQVRQLLAVGLKPLTDEQILTAFRGAKKIHTDHAGWVKEQRIVYGRAIEAAHSITGEPT